MHSTLAIRSCQVPAGAQTAASAAPAQGQKALCPSVPAEAEQAHDVCKPATTAMVLRPTRSLMAQLFYPHGSALIVEVRYLHNGINLCRYGVKPPGAPTGVQPVLSSHTSSARCTPAEYLGLESASSRALCPLSPVSSPHCCAATAPRTHPCSRSRAWGSQPGPPNPGREQPGEAAASFRLQRRPTHIWRIPQGPHGSSCCPPDRPWSTLGRRLTQQR